MEKKINYLARTFNDIKTELLDFSEKYYPELSDSFNDSSVGAWFIDLVSAVGDNLSYYTDRVYQTTNINSANTKKSLKNLARSNGVKLPGPKPSMCEVELSITLPVGTNNSSPNWDYAPLIKKASSVGNGKYQFEIAEDVNFATQFNEDGYPNRKYTPNRNSNGIITSYTVSKTVLALGGQSRIYKKVISSNDLKPFMEIILPEMDIMNVESILFKECSSLSVEPMSFEYKIEEEEFRLKGQSVYTYRFFEVDSLADQYRFAPQSKCDEGNEFGDGTTIADYFPYEYVDYEEPSCEECYDLKDDEKEECLKKYKDIVPQRVSRYVKGVWKPITQKFITEYTDNGFLKIIFGGGSDYFSNDDLKDFNSYITSKIVNNDTLGVLPKVGWSMYVRYRVGGGASANLAANSITSALNMNLEFNGSGEDKIIRGDVVKSLKVTNPSTVIGGKDAPSNEEIKYLIKYNNGSQKRCVTLKDYKERLMMIPPKYGAPFRCSAIEDNNKIIISYLGMRATGLLDKALPQTLVSNMIQYLSHYKNLGDYIEFKSGNVYNLGFQVEVFIDKNYTVADVIHSIIQTIKEYMNVSKHDMGEDIFIGDLEREINQLDGVISLIDLKIYALYGGTYRDKCSLPEYTPNYSPMCNSNGEIEKFIGSGVGESFRIDLDSIDSVLRADYNSMFEIMYDKDIHVKVKVK